MTRAIKKTGGMRKLNRNRAWCENYRRLGLREIRKARKLKRHLAGAPHDKTAHASWERLPADAKARAGR